jgi:diguanylate cyclase (GGDEF)-like protein/PAS domain S-box-containing protein
LPFSHTNLLRDFDESTSAVLREQFARAERAVNAVRIAVLGVLAIAAAAYAPYLASALNIVNIAVFTPILLWAVVQHLRWHARGMTPRWLPAANAFSDVTAVSMLALSYGLVDHPAFTVKSPILYAYFLILAARPFTGSPGLAMWSAVVAATEYVLAVAYLVAEGRLQMQSSPVMSVTGGGTTWLDEASKVIFLLAAGAVAAYATRWSERTLRQAVASRRNFEARFHAVFEHSAFGVALLNEQGIMLEANEAMGSMFGVSTMQLIGRSVGDFAPAAHRETAQALIDEIAPGVAGRSAGEVRFLRRDGSEFWGSVTVSVATGARDVRFIAMVEDVSERKVLEAKLLQQAFYDGLTGLANRSLFRDRVEHALARGQRERAAVAVLFLDLDHFKHVNDTLGHAAGDNLLQVVAGRLLNATRGADTVARLGGDEFAVLLENAPTEAEARIVAERITNALHAPVVLAQGNSVRVASSIGIARAEGAQTVDDLLRNADVAMYAAKSTSRGGWVFFDPSMHSALVDRVTLESDMRRALEDNEFWVAYQPIVDLTSQQVTGLEALVRWRHPMRGTIPPSSFVPVAEETGLILPIGQLVLMEACRQVAQWNTDGRDLSITVNLSARQLQAPELERDVQMALATSGLSPSHLVLEITESVLMDSGGPTLGRLQALKALGVRLAIDDFGTGYSSLSYLQQFPVDILKIDRSFTNGLMRGPNEDALARTIIALGDLLTLRTIAEGVEQEGQHLRLRDLGCDCGQGYLFGHPVSAAEMTVLFSQPQLALRPPAELAVKT